MARNYLAGTHGDAANAILAAAGYNFRRLLEWLALLLSITGRPQRRDQSRSAAQTRLKAFFTGDYFTYIITTRRITSGELLKYRNGSLMA
jgi:hypothetical protein